MRLSFRLILALIAGVTAVSLGFALYQAGVEVRAQRDEVSRHASVLAESMRTSAESLVLAGAYSDLQAMVDEFQNHERLAGVAVYDQTGMPLAMTSSLAAPLTAAPNAVTLAIQSGVGQGQFFRLAGQPMHVFAKPLRGGPGVIGAIAIFYNVAYISAHRTAVLLHALASVAIQTILIVCITLLIVRWSLGRPLRRMAQWLRDQRTGRPSSDGEPPKEEIFGPLASEVTQLATSFNAARAAAQEEARLRDAAESLWTPERLRVSVRSKLNGSRLFVVSNREPYEHLRRGSSIVCSVPASGLVTALEPVLRACDGTWIAQGTGDADREAADEQRPPARAARPSALHPPPRVADQRRRGGLLFRLRQRRALAALPHRPHAPHLPRRRLGTLPDREPQVRRRGRPGDGRPKRSPWCWCRTTISPCCRA